MDSDLLTDLYGFLPEKYFVHRRLCSKTFRSETKISFTDYFRQEYFISGYSYGYKKMVRKNTIDHTTANIITNEYGPHWISERTYCDCESWYIKTVQGVRWATIYRGKGRYAGYKITVLLGESVLTINGEKCSDEWCRSMYCVFE